MDGCCRARHSRLCLDGAVRVAAPEPVIFVLVSALTGGGHFE